MHTGKDEVTHTGYMPQDMIDTTYNAEKECELFFTFDSSRDCLNLEDTNDPSVRILHLCLNRYKRDTNGSGIQLSIRYAFFSNGEGGVFFRWIPSQEYEFDPEYPGLLSLIFWENKQEIVSQLMDSMDAEGFHDIMMNN